MLISHNKSNTVALVSGPYLTFLRHHAEKYSKFTYSSHYGFNGENNLKEFSSASLDNMIGLSYTGRDFYFRHSSKSWIFKGDLYSEWSPNGADKIEVKLWIIQKEDYHIRIHHVYQWTENINLPSEADLERLKSNAVREKCNVPS